MNKLKNAHVQIQAMPSGRGQAAKHRWKPLPWRISLNAHLLAGVLLLSGCSSLFEEQPKGPWATLKQSSRQCLGDLKADSDLKIIANKVTLDSHYDRDAYFELLGIEEVPTSKEKIVIRKWVSKLEHCFKIKAESYAYEPPTVAMWSAASDNEQLALVLELSKGNLKYGEFAAKRLEVDTRYRGQIMRAISADYKKQSDLSQPKNAASPKSPSTSNSSCGWENNQWVCRSL